MMHRQAILAGLLLPTVCSDELINLRCTQGISDRRGSVCCAVDCAECGGAGCDLRPGGAASCCGGSIVQVCTDSVGPPPCVYLPLIPEKCTDGILEASGAVCCPAEC